MRRTWIILTLVLAVSAHSARAQQKPAVAAAPLTGNKPDVVDLAWIVPYTSGVLASRMASWRPDLQSMNFNLPGIAPARRSGLDRQRVACLREVAVMHALLQAPSTTGNQVRLFKSVNRLSNLLNGLDLSLAEIWHPARNSGNPQYEPVFKLAHRLDPMMGDLQPFQAELGALLAQQLRSPVSNPVAAGLPALPGSISGHVVRADTGQSLRNVAVVLGYPYCGSDRSLIALHQLRAVRTGADGSYSFSRVASGLQSVTACMPGFLPATVNANVPASGTAAQSDDEKSIANLHLTPAPKVIAMSNRALVVAAPLHMMDRYYNDGRFSPDGRMFAIVSGAVWLYRLRSHALLPLPLPHWPIRRLYWSGPTLCAEMGAGQYPNNPVTQCYGLQSGALQQVPTVPRPRHERFGHPDRFPTFHDPWRRVLGNRRYTVTVSDVYHSFLKLTMRERGSSTRHVVANGTWELESFLLDRQQSRVYFPKRSDQSNRSGIGVFDLETRRARVWYLPNTSDLRLLDAVQTSTGMLIAYRVDGPCQPNTPAPYDSLQPLPPDLQLLAQPLYSTSFLPSVCFARISAHRP